MYFILVKTEAFVNCYTIIYNSYLEAPVSVTTCHWRSGFPQLRHSPPTPPAACFRYRSLLQSLARRGFVIGWSLQIQKQPLKVKLKQIENEIAKILSARDAKSALQNQNYSRYKIQIPNFYLLKCTFFQNFQRCNKNM